MSVFVYLYTEALDLFSVFCTSSIVNNASLELETVFNPFSIDSSDVPLVPEFTDPLNIAKECIKINLREKLADESNYHHVHLNYL